MNNQELKEKIKSICKIENLLCFFIIICPILDAASFIFRNTYNTNISITTFIRPIISIVAIIYIFIKNKIKLPIVIAGMTYFIYAICHLYIFYRIKTGCAYGTEINEIRYLVNYTFMILNLFIYMYIFIKQTEKTEIKDEDKGKSIEKLKKSVLISLTLYISLMYISLITKTSSYTYLEGKIGSKGWFESGNSIGAVMLLSLFIILPMISKKQKDGIRIWSFIVTVLTGVYLTTLLGTRTGLFGFGAVIAGYIILLIIYNIIHNKKSNIKTVIEVIVILILIAITVVTVGSSTIERRRQLKEREDLIYDDMRKQTSHVTGDMLKIIKQIKNGTIDEEYMSEDMKQTMLKLYDIANEEYVSSTNMRRLQLIYHSQLIKQQDNIPMLLFGNGYFTHFNEMVYEMEVPAFLYNFGIIGFFLYFIPFLAIAIYSIYVIIREYKKITIEFVMYTLGLCFAILISCLSGYTFFNISTALIIVVLAVLAVNEIKEMENNKIKIYIRKNKD